MAVGTRHGTRNAHQGAEPQPYPLPGIETLPPVEQTHTRPCDQRGQPAAQPAGRTGHQGNSRRGTRLPPRRTHPQDEPHRQPCGTQRGQMQTPRPARQQGRHRHQSQPRIHVAGMPELRMHRPSQPQNQRPVPLHLLRIHASCRHQRQPQHTCETFPQGWMAFHRQEANPRHAPQRARRAMLPPRPSSGRRHVAKSATTPRNAKTSPEVKAPNGIKNH